MGRATTVMSSALERATDWLYYNHQYQVLICRECQHAIQKSAIDSHLLKHKIYRSERQSLLDEVATLNLPEPGDVQQPTHFPPPIEGLPVLHGYRCIIEECTHLTLSEKRVKRHWNEVHSAGSPLPPISEIARPACLQTLFKGTKLNYFEVTTAFNDRQSGCSVSKGDRLQRAAGTSQIVHEDLISADVRTLASATSGSPLPYSSDIHPTSYGLDLETLSCLHHFITVTAHGLPGSLHYWQEQVFALAREHAALMNGLLALAAKQQALTANTVVDSQNHDARHERFHQDFQNMSSVMLVGGAGHQSVDHQTMTLAVQIDALLRCARRVSNKQVAGQRSWTYSSFAEIVHDIGLCCARKPETLETTPSIHHQAQASSQAIYQYLRDLPSRMAYTLGRPTSAEDVLATLAAISALCECCETSFSSETAASAWEGMSTWLTLVPDHFHKLLDSRYTAAVVVFTHWAGILVRRAELIGCWPVRGLSETILSECAGYLSANAPAAKSLIADVLQ